MVERLDQYRREETAALRREQQLHIEAAARQLEVLATLEHSHSDTNEHGAEQPLPFADVDESYITRQARADAGAGLVPTGVSPNIITPSTPSLAGTPSVPSVSLQQPNQAGGYSRPFDSTSVEQSHFGIHNSELPSRLSSSSGLGHRSSVAHHPGLSAGLSSELRRILNMSTLVDADSSVADSLFVADLAEDEERGVERQYLWLERYHAHVTEQQRQETIRESSALEVPVVGSSNYRQFPASPC